ncbi:hypothetical protein [Streptomyces sp. WG-D5]
MTSLHGRRHTGRPAAIEAPARNHYFHGRLMNVPTFELETEYFLRRDRLFTRLALGPGVVRGLDVEVTDDDRVRIRPGLAVDGWGRRIAVPERTDPLEIPYDVMESAVQRAGACRDDAAVQLVLCYHECLDDPVPAYTDDCGDPRACQPSTVRERHRVEFRDRPARKPPPGPLVAGLLRDGRVDQDVLARWVSRECRVPTADPCVPLANLKVTPGPDGSLRCPPDGADITVRPVAPTNAVLTALLLALLDYPPPGY